MCPYVLEIGIEILRTVCTAFLISLTRWYTLASALVSRSSGIIPVSVMAAWKEILLLPLTTLTVNLRCARRRIIFSLFLLRRLSYYNGVSYRAMDLTAPMYRDRALCLDPQTFDNKHYRKIAIPLIFRATRAMCLSKSNLWSRVTPMYFISAWICTVSSHTNNGDRGSFLLLVGSKDQSASVFLLVTSNPNSWILSVTAFTPTCALRRVLSQLLPNAAKSI